MYMLELAQQETGGRLPRSFALGVLRALRGKCRTLLLIALVTLEAMVGSPECAAQTRRALLIGINIYHGVASDEAVVDTSDSAAQAAGAHDSVAGSARTQRRALVGDLSAAVNDAMAMQALLHGRYHFRSDNTRLLTDAGATRAGILTAIDELIAASQQGDIVVFFYAGHGSQRVNSKAPPTFRDQTLVPADANAGAFDIRNKELGRAFGKLLDKGVVLTLIFDSCHSGAITRGGVRTATRERWADLDPRDAADPADFTPPERRGALVLSATQEYGSADEVSYPEPHGVFTSALLTVLRTARTKEPAIRVFQRVKAAMQAAGHDQEPVLAASAERQRAGLFGGGDGVEDRTTVAVLSVDNMGQVILQGGTAIGLAKNTELRQLDTRAGQAVVRLSVTEVPGLTRSNAVIVAGRREDLASGDLFEVVAWAGQDAPILRVWMPEAVGGPAAARAIARFSQLRTSPAVRWLDDPTNDTVQGAQTFTILWEQGRWRVQPPFGEPLELGTPPSAASVL
jgi:Caspase domain